MLVDDWSELTKSEELNAWTMAKLEESNYQARQEDDQRKSTVGPAAEHGLLEADLHTSRRAERSRAVSRVS